MQQRGLFISGTDTGVGKTVVGTALSRYLYSQRQKVQVRKPIESGCIEQAGELLPQDGLAYQAAVNSSIPLDTITPFRLRAPLSPQRAARLEQRSISLAVVLEAVTRSVAAEDFLLVEGAGGFYSPLTADGLNADLAQALGLPVLLVAADRLGCLNHILLTAAAIAERQLQLAAVVLNAGAVTDAAAADLGNAEELTQYMNCPIYTLERITANHNEPEIELWWAPIAGKSQLIF